MMVCLNSLHFLSSLRKIVRYFSRVESGRYFSWSFWGEDGTELVELPLVVMSFAINLVSRYYHCFFWLRLCSGIIVSYKLLHTRYILGKLYKLNDL